VRRKRRREEKGEEKEEEEIVHLSRQHRFHHQAGALQKHHVTHGLATLQHHHIARHQGMRRHSPDPPRLDNGGQAAVVHQGHHLQPLPA